MDDAQHTEKAVHALHEAGFSNKELSVVMRDWSENGESEVSRASAIQASTLAVAVAGAAPGLLVTLASLSIPGLGWLRAIGTLGAALGAVPGAAYGLAVGELCADAFPEQQSRVEEESVKLTMALIAINGWNRLAIAFRPEVGKYPPRAKAA
jgi:hypothetical protein